MRRPSDTTLAVPESELALALVARAGLGTETPAAVARSAVEWIGQTTKAALVVAAEVLEDGTLAPLASSPPGADVSPAVLAPGSPLALACSRLGPVRTTDLPAVLTALGLCSALAVAAPNEDGPLAAVAVYGGGPDCCGPEDVRFVHALATLVAQTVQRTRRFDELAASEARWQALVDHAPVGILEIDVDARVTAANEAAARLFGTRAEPLGNSYLNAVAPPDRARVAMRLSQALEGATERFEFRGAFDDLVFEAQFIPLFGRDGAASRLIGVTLDVTEARRSVEALAKSEQRFRRLFDSAADFIALIDEDDRFIALNRSFARSLGYEPAELVGRPAADLLTPESLEIARSAVWRIVRDQEQITSYRVEEVARDGTRIPVEFTAQVVQENGRPVFLTIGRSVGEREELEAQLRQAQKLEAIGRLAGGIAHDFNNLLTAITGYAELAARNPDEDSAYVESILEAAGRATELTDQLLTFSRRHPVEQGPLDLNETVLHVEDMLRRVIGEDVRLTVDASASPSTILGDAGQLEQVLVNLAVNARDAMPRGGELTIETQTVALDVAYTSRHPGIAAGTYALLAVSDTGVGMDEATQQRLFEPFFTTKPPGEGTGLGLATVHGVVDQFGGSIHVYSEPGRGTTFKIYFPLFGGAERPRACPAQAPVRAAAGETILLVEDDEAVRKLAQRVLEQTGYRVVSAASCSEAARAAGTAADIRLALSDVVLPDGSGVDLAVRLNDDNPRLRWLFMSGYGDQAVATRGELPEGAAFIGKPFAVDALAAKVRDVLDAV